MYLLFFKKYFTFFIDLFLSNKTCAVSILLTVTYNLNKNWLCRLF
ncbi:hypothetical protein MuYL_3553 [Mucilaginibacter xinganensis]|uniref:Uncharacterized protein n=1 Tax=Mucilaginibacter xinganensis TaxID=1234841 RepID=A0A223P0T0_9SPHI|nr:hypothetical protein MuYL_3553 [Mucilaginibacter xinganensis]